MWQAAVSCGESPPDCTCDDGALHFGVQRPQNLRHVVVSDQVLQQQHRAEIVTRVSVLAAMHLPQAAASWAPTSSARGRHRSARPHHVAGDYSLVHHVSFLLIRVVICHWHLSQGAREPLIGRLSRAGALEPCCASTGLLCTCCMTTRLLRPACLLRNRKVSSCLELRSPGCRALSSE
jgi:hypothetical protein